MAVSSLSSDICLKSHTGIGWFWAFYVPLLGTFLANLEELEQQGIENSSKGSTLHYDSLVASCRDRHVLLVFLCYLYYKCENLCLNMCLLLFYAQTIGQI